MSLNGASVHPRLANSAKKRNDFIQKKLSSQRGRWELRVGSLSPGGKGSLES